MQLTTKFHRSKIVIVSSQVSRVAGKISDCWDKKRRLEAAFAFIRRIRPYDVLRAVETGPLDSSALLELSFADAQKGFDGLSKKQTSCVLLRYGGGAGVGGAVVASPPRPRREEVKQEKESSVRAVGTTPSPSGCGSRELLDKCDVQKLSETTLPTRFGDFNVQVWRTKRRSSFFPTTVDDNVLVAPKEDTNNLIVLLTTGTVGAETTKLHLRVHDACITSETFGSVLCDCKQQLELSQKRMQSAEVLGGVFDVSNKNETLGGMILYTFQEGRGIGLSAKIAAYDAQSRLGLDTLAANLHLGLPADARDYSWVGEVFRKLKIDTGKTQIVLLTNNPNKVEKLREAGLKIAARKSCVSREIEVGSPAGRYLQAKTDLMHHRVRRDGAGRFAGIGDEEETINEKKNSDEDPAPDRRQVANMDDMSDLPAAVQPLIRAWAANYHQFMNRGPSPPQCLHDSCSHGDVEEVKRRPFVTLSYASGLDGCVGSEPEKPRLLLSGAQSSEFTHLLRAGHDAILIGIGTALADDPQLTVRGVSSAARTQIKRMVGGGDHLEDGMGKNDPMLIGGGRAEQTEKQLLPVVLDSGMRLPLTARLVQNAIRGSSSPHKPPTPDEGVPRPGLVVFTSRVYIEGAAGRSSEGTKKHAERVRSMRTQPGVLVLETDTDLLETGRFLYMPEVLRILNEFLGIKSVMVEGGKTVITQLLHHHEILVDQIALTLAPAFYGTGNGVSGPVMGRGEDGVAKGGLAGSEKRLHPLLPPVLLGDDVVLLGKLLEPMNLSGSGPEDEVFDRGNP